MFTVKESMLKWGAALGMLAVSAIFLACSDDKSDVAGGASGDMGIVAKDIAGEALKGPFVKGSAVTVQGIDCKKALLFYGRCLQCVVYLCQTECVHHCGLLLARQYI